MAMLRLSALRLLLLATVSVLLLTGQVSPPPLVQVEIPGVSPLLLERFGTTLLPPDASPMITAEQARAVAVAEGPTYDVPILQTVLVRLLDAHVIPPVDRLVWVNMIDVAGQPDPWPKPPWALPAQSLYTFELIYVDANTGEYMYFLYD